MPTAFVSTLCDGRDPGHAEVVRKELQSGLSIREVRIRCLGGCITVSTPALLELHALNPRVASLQLHNVSPSLDALPGSSLAFRNLASLTVYPFTASLYDTGMLFGLFKFMPRLRALELSMPHNGPFPESDAGGYLPPPPFSLESFVYRGFIPVSAFALIVQLSSRTLRTLHIHDVWYYDGGELLFNETVETVLFNSLLAAAPQLRDFHVALPSVGTALFVERMQQVFAAFSAMTSLSISASSSLEWSTAQLIDNAPPGIAIRHLQLNNSNNHFRFNPRWNDSVDIPLDCLCHAPQLRKLRSLSLVGFSPSEYSTRALLDYCLQRRIRWLREEEY